MYAQYTNVTVEKSIEEIRSALVKFGATDFSYASHPGEAQLGFHYKSNKIKIVVPMAQAPGEDASLAEKKKFEQLRKTKWRQILLCIKAKMEIVLSGIETFEEAFMPHILLDNGENLGKQVLSQFIKAKPETKSEAKESSEKNSSKLGTTHLKAS